MKRFTVFVSVFLLFISCSNSQPNPPQSSATIHPETVLDKCGSFIYPALYHLNLVSGKINWPDVLMGQPADAFSDFIPEKQREQIKTQFISHFSRAKKSGIIDEQISWVSRWCVAAQSWYQQDGYHVSLEEFLAFLYSDEQFKALFEPYRERPIFQSGEPEPIDKVASLSSAEVHSVLSNWFTLLSKLSQNEFDRALERSKSINSETVAR